MKQQPSTPASLNLSLLLARIPLGLYLGVSGYQHIVAPGGVGAFVAANLATASRFMPAAVAHGYLTALPFAELLAAALLFFGLYQRIGALLAAALMASVVVATGVKWMQGTTPFDPCLVFLGLSLLLLSTGPGKLSFDAAMSAASQKKPPKPA